MRNCVRVGSSRRSGRRSSKAPPGGGSVVRIRLALEPATVRSLAALARKIHPERALSPRATTERLLRLVLATPEVACDLMDIQLDAFLREGDGAGTFAEYLRQQIAASTARRAA